MCFNILLISTKLDSMHLQLNNVRNRIYSMNVDILFDPSKVELEEKLYENIYDCVIPCSLYSFMGLDQGHFNRKVYNFNILQLLDLFRVPHFGYDYIHSLIVNDDGANLMNSKFCPKQEIITQYYFEKTIANKCISKADFPIQATPIYFTDYLSDSNHNLFSQYEAESLFNAFFKSNVDEILVKKQIEYDIEVTITIIGNPPFSKALMYIFNNKNNTYEIMDVDAETEQYSDIITDAYKLFSELSLKDYGQFQYVLNIITNSYNIINIDGDHCLNPICIKTFEEFYNLNLEYFIQLLILVFIIRQNNMEQKAINFYKNVIPCLPQDLLNLLLPIRIKNLLSLEYDYKNICHEIKEQFLRVDESNRYSIIEMLDETMKNLPEQQNYYSPFLWNKDSDYSFLDNYEKIPLYPQEPQNILNLSLQILNGQMRWHSSHMFYNINPPVMFSTIAASAITNLYNPNAMAQKTSAGIIKMEKQITAQLSELIGWDNTESAGIFTMGGKICLSYAIKSGLNRCAHYTTISQKPVIITSEINHFSIEAVCYELGLSKSSCIRIPTTRHRTIDFEAFNEIIEDCFSHKIPIACVIFSGGNTTHCAFEDINIGSKLIISAANKYCSPYFPYIYYDLVVGWPWLFFKTYDFEENALNIKDSVIFKIKKILSKLNYAYLADGVGIDFHKGGFCPFSNSIFLSHQASDLYFLNDDTIDENFREPYHYTFCNSRSATSIISAWNVLQGVGVQGFQAYIANVMTVINTFITSFPSIGFEIIDAENTYGFAILVWSHEPDIILTYKELHLQPISSVKRNNRYLFQLSEYLLNYSQHGFYLRFLPKYEKLLNGEHIAALSLLPMTMNINCNIATKISTEIGLLKKKFDKMYSPTRELLTIMPEEVPK